MDIGIPYKPTLKSSINTITLLFIDSLKARQVIINALYFFSTLRTILQSAQLNLWPFKSVWFIRVRAVFIVDDKAKLRIMFYYPQELGRNMDEILRAVKGMQISEANEVAIPTGWPNNELIKDSVIVLPADNVKTAKERTGATDCYDWWFF